jgi:hypothetical protein
MTTEILDTGQDALWTTDQRRRLGRCESCEYHPETQGHHPDCLEPRRRPHDVAAGRIDRTAALGSVRLERDTQTARDSA